MSPFHPSAPATSLLFLALPLLSGCCRDEHRDEQRDAAPVLAPASPSVAPWKRAWIRTRVTWYPPTGAAIFWFARANQTLHVDLNGRPSQVSLLDAWSYAKTLHDSVREHTLVLQPSPDGKAIGVSADGKTWREVRFDVQPNPFYCPHLTFEGNDWPTAKAVVLDLLAPTHVRGATPARPLPPGVTEDEHGHLHGPGAAAVEISAQLTGCLPDFAVPLEANFCHITRDGQPDNGRALAITYACEHREDAELAAVCDKLGPH